MLSRSGTAGLLLAMAGAMIAAPGASGAQQIHGDVNGDGVVSALDAQAILAAVVGLPLPAGFVIANGDADCNDTAVALDAQIVLSAVIGLNVSQYCVGQPFGVSSVRVSVTPGDTSLLINRGIQLRAVVRDTGGFAIQRPVVWSTSNADIVTIDSSRADTAWVKARNQAGTVTISAFSDGAQGSIAIQVFTSYAGVVITPQRSDTLRQLNAPYSFTLRTRDSLGAISGAPTGTWTTSNTAIASVTPGPSNTATLTTNSNGTVFLRVTSTASSTLRDSVRLVVRLPALNSCTGTGGTLHPNTTYTTPQTWLASENPHFVTGNQTFNAGSGLTVGPGALVCLSSGVQMLFNAGTRLVARGKTDSLITFTGVTPTTTWSGIQLGNAFSYSGTAPTDTSWITNALLERGGSSQGITGREQHALVMDSVRLRQFVNQGARLFGPGSRLSRSTVDTLTSASGAAVTVGRGVLELTTVRAGSASTGVFITDTGTVRNVQIIGGGTAIFTSSFVNGVRLNDVTISGTTDYALDLDDATVHPTSANVQISGGTGGAFRGEIGNLGILFADSVRQETLKGNGKDTLFVTGGSLTNATVVVRPDLPWVVNEVTNIDTLGVVAPRPGSRLLFNFAGFRFQQGGRLNAIGEAAKPIRFVPQGTAAFYGLFFQNPGAGPDPELAPTTTSNISFAQIDSASGGLGIPSGSFCCAASIAAGNRHRIIADSIIVRKSLQGAVFLATPGSELKRSVIDTTGDVSSSYTASYPAVALGRKTLAQNVLVRRSGNVGIYSSAASTDTIARLVNVRIVASRGAGLQVDNGILEGDLGLVRIDSANAYPYDGPIQSFAAIARDSISQLNLRGNVDDVALITGGTLSGTPGVNTPAAPLVLTVIPGLRWQVTQSPNVDTLAQLNVRPGSNITFTDGILYFTRGGALNAVGTPTNFIRFRPVTGNQWQGLRFDEPGAGSGGPGTWPYATSTMTYVRVDSAGGTSINGFTTCCFSAAIAGATRHRLLLDSIIVHKAFNNAIWLNASGSYLKRSLIDTTGTVGTNFTTSQAAVALGDSITVENTLIRRSGYVGLYAPRLRALLTNIRVVGSQNVALQLDQNAMDPASTNVRADSANAYPFYGRIDNFGVIANTAALQTANLLGNVDNVAVIVGGTLTNRTVDVIPQLRWQVTQSPAVDTGAVLQPQPGADITFTDGNLRFQRGGILNAVGTTTNFIRFRPVAGSQWSGLQFDSPGTNAGAENTWPIAVSTMTYVRVDSAAGTSINNFTVCCYSAAIAGGIRHRLLLDSVIVHKAFNNAVWLNGRGSYLKRSLIDTTGNVGTGYTTSQPAVVLGDTITVENTLIRRSGYVGLYAPRFRALLTNVRVVASRNVALQLDQNAMDPASTNVRADSANAYPFYGRIDNFGVIANTAALQISNLIGTGNTDNVAVIVAGSLTNRTVEVIPQLRWQVTQSPSVDAGAVLQVQPGANITFTDGNLSFRQGGTLNAIGTSTNLIRFRPVAGFSWSGLQFDSPATTGGAESTWPIAVSTLTHVRLDSAAGTSINNFDVCCYSAAIAGATRHRLLLDSVVVHKAYNNALWLNASGSYVRGSLIDTTGNVASNYQTSQPAVVLSDSIEISRTLVRRSGGDGIYLPGNAMTLDSVRVVSSRLDGWVLGQNGTTYSGTDGGDFFDEIVSDSNGGVGYSIRNNNITLRLCAAKGNASHGAATTSSYSGVTIEWCDFVQNGGNGVNNATTIVASVINANNNWWGDPAGPTGLSGDGVGTNVTATSFCGGPCTTNTMMPLVRAPSTPAIPPRSYHSRSLLRSRRRRRLTQ